MAARALTLGVLAFVAVVTAVFLLEDPTDRTTQEERVEQSGSGSQTASVMKEEEDWLRTAIELLQPGVTAAEPGPLGGRWVLEGRVSDLRGSGLADVRVQLATGRHDFLPQNESQETSAPLSRALIRGPVLAQTRTNVAGEWRIDLAHSPARLPEFLSVAVVLAEAVGHQDGGQLLDAPTLEYGGRCELVLAKGATILGRVFTPEGAPAEGAASFTGGWGYTFTDAAGGFRVSVPAEQTFALMITHPSGTASRGELRVPLGEELDLGDLHLRGPGRLAGRVLLPDGTPAPQLPIRVRRADLLAYSSPNPEDFARGHSWNSVRTDANGLFAAGGLSDAEFRVHAFVNGMMIELHARGVEQPTSYPSCDGRERDFILPWRLILLNAPLEAEGRYAEVIASGASIREDGAKPPDTDFRLLLTTQAAWSAEPVPLLFSGPGWLRFQGTMQNGQRVALAHLELREEQWLYSLPLHFEDAGAHGAILIRGMHPYGYPFKWLNCQLFNAERGLYGREQSLEARGDDWLLSGVPEGTWRLTVADGARPSGIEYVLAGTFEVTVRGGETALLDWTPRLGGSLQLLADTDGTGASSGIEPIVRAIVIEGPQSRGEYLSLMPVGPHRPTPSVTEFRPGVLMRCAAPLEPGEYRVRFEATGFQSQEISVTLVAEEAARCFVRLVAER